MNRLLGTLGRGRRAVILVVGAVVAGIAGVAAEAFWVRREKPESKDAYRWLDEDGSKTAS